MYHYCNAYIQESHFHLNLLKTIFISESPQNNYSIMFRALKVFFAFLYLVLSIQAVVTASADVDHDKESSVTLPGVKLAASLNGPVVLASQASAVSTNLRKKDEIEVELEGM